MICFGVGFVLGGAAGMCVSGLLNNQEDQEKSDEWYKECETLRKRIDDAIHHAVVVKEAAGYQKMALVRFADEMIGILQGDKK